MPRLRPARRRASIAATLAGVIVLSLGLAQPAAAVEYPSWEDVEAARSSETSKQSAIVQIEGLVQELKNAAALAEAEAVLRADEYEAAQLAVDEASYRAVSLREQAVAATTVAETSKRQAGALVAAWLRSGNIDLSTAAFLDNEPEALLGRLSTISKLSESTDGTYDRAKTDANTASLLTEQATIAEAALGDLAAAAETALGDAVAARADAETAVADQQEYLATLEAQLIVLKENRAATEADYRKGEEVRAAAAAAAAAAVAAAEAARVAAEAAANAAANAGGGGGGGGGASSGAVGGQGWALPISGRITDNYGPRPGRPVPGVNAFHSGTDIGAGCGRAVYAANAGQVVYAGWLGTYGNWVLIDHGGGVMTGYAHNSSILVGEGQSVSAGQNISLVGSTGASSGCHVHFEVRIGGSRVDAVPFMADRGIRLG
ncbi:M23 family metallopeptidase [Plantibacter sp. VKM Ac-2880]|uniref:M23 family metallopeptidase n=1 Tax=Plantibacter sp. VKM Ac-2880 TaxID=2783827 RepID=UPI00188F4EC9|nr:M23 family metallopeptidase [Plantibacter sp. VKM Ac-2880]MBF4568199.1 M23 family metallopeptidase [Plantibacter sp. VKM Ac-2880]